MAMSDFRKEQRKSLASRRNLEWLHLELSKINGEVQSIVPGNGINGTWGVPRYGIGEEVYEQNGNDSVFNYTDEEPVIDMEFPAVGSKAEPVPDPLLKPFICDVSAPKSCDSHLGEGEGEGSSKNASDISNAKGFGTDGPSNTGDEKDTEEELMSSFAQEIEELMEMQQAHEEENSSDVI